MLSVFWSLLFLAPSFALTQEPTILNPVDDANLIRTFQLADPKTADRVNILVVGLDGAGSPDAKMRNPRQRLSSRSDIMAILSVDKIKNKISIFSYGRDMELNSTCSRRVNGRDIGDVKLNATYVLSGRRVFVRCIEQLTKELVSVSQGLRNEYLDQNGEFRLHAIMEGTRNDTIRPMGVDALTIAKSNKFFLSTTYGFGGFAELASVIINKQKFKEQFNEAFQGEDISSDKLLAERNLVVELKERKIYPAGSYQRAFNFATFISDTLGWIAYGIQQNRQSRPFFLGELFGEAINKNFSRTHNFVELEKNLTAPNNPNDNLLRYAGYINGKSPVRVIQWGEDHGIYAIYENGQMQISKNNRGAFLGGLKPVKIMPTPPDCKECHL